MTKEDVTPQFLLKAGMYLTGMYQRRLKEEKQHMSNQAVGLPSLGILTFMSMYRLWIFLKSI